MNTRQILSTVLVMLGTIAAILPAKSTRYRAFTPDELDTEVKRDAYYFSPDEVAHMLISGDPTLQLVDIRDQAASDTLLPRAINIPTDSLLTKKYEGLLYQRVNKTVLYGDDPAEMKAAWKKLKYDGYPNVYMLKGGLEAWNETILHPEHPGPLASQDEIDRYNQRAAARLYFTGAKALPKVEFDVIIPQGSGKKRRVEGGCS